MVSWKSKIYSGIEKRTCGSSIHEKNINKILENYQPISFLCIVGEIFKRILCIVFEFFTEANLYFPTSQALYKEIHALTIFYPLLMKFTNIEVKFDIY